MRWWHSAQEEALVQILESLVGDADSGLYIAFYDSTWKEVRYRFRGVLILCLYLCKALPQLRIFLKKLFRTIFLPFPPQKKNSRNAMDL